MAKDSALATKYSVVKSAGLSAGKKKSAKKQLKKAEKQLVSLTLKEYLG